MENTDQPTVPFAERFTGEDLRIPIRTEELIVEKEPLTLGSVRIHKGVESFRETLDVAVYHEEAVVERIGPHELTSDRANDPDVIVVPIYEEQIVVQTRAVLKEYVRIRKRRVEERKVVTAPVRREFVEVRDGTETGG